MSKYMTEIVAKREAKLGLLRRAALLSSDHFIFCPVRLAQAQAGYLPGNHPTRVALVGSAVCCCGGAR